MEGLGRNSLLLLMVLVLLLMWLLKNLMFDEAVQGGSMGMHVCISH